MAGKALHLRCKSRNGQQMLSGITAATTVAQLKQKLAELSRIQVGALKVLHGYPPIRMDLSISLATVSTLGLSSGDTLIVEEDSSVLATGEALSSEAIAVAKSSTADRKVSAQLQQNAGLLMRKVVPSDNSCLFTSVNYVLTGALDVSCSRDMRKLIADVVTADADTYNDAFLEKSNKEYAEWIAHEDAWGGAIELSILAKHHGVEMAVLDAQTGRIDRYGEDAHYPTRVLLIYDGLHYDPLVMERASEQTTVFAIGDDYVWQQALQLGVEARSSRQYTDVKRFALRCMVCDVALTGQTEAQEHALASGHTNFGEV
ncbi:PREDICTED: ubiquitin thioesterase OTU1-like [Priapulus caudatus]|uniref:Ubiquitin thioesterase OTU n=1 Tax=Priapulus caudatus TaxID=37621 RepID=A0ABM1EY46_PRICU|nr:PREDICTED: ubiquitin thioesterase OTU1-like [Priapulus caudatus]XP_014677117.1 PREDICTED: ubiquitin thioesterase OTU1-like [Priapulus caudatus]